MADYSHVTIVNHFYNGLVGDLRRVFEERVRQFAVVCLQQSFGSNGGWRRLLLRPVAVPDIVPEFGPPSDFGPWRVSCSPPWRRQAGVTVSCGKPSQVVPQ